MSGDGARPDHPASGQGASASGRDAPIAVDTSLDEQSRKSLIVVLVGPIVWAAHFMLVYTVSEAGCTGEGPGLRVFGPPVPMIVTLGATALGGLACLACAAWAYGRWRTGQRDPTADEAGDPSVDVEVREFGGSMAFAGLLLSLLSFVSVLMVGLPALLLPPC